MRTLPKVCHYLDIPIQHASDHILRRMARRTTHDEIVERIARLKERIPDIVLRTTMISGFPGETLKDHEILLDFIRNIRFDRLGDFEYSREEGTKAAGFSHQVSAAEKKRRRDEVMTLQQSIAEEKAGEQIGKRLEAIIEGRLCDDGGQDERPEITDKGNIYVGRTYMDAPDVDGLIYINTGKREFMTGDFVTVSVTGASGYDLIGEL